MASPAVDVETSDNDIRKKLFKNSGLIMGCRVVTAATSLISVPFITSKIGLDGFGSWESLIAIAALCAMFQNAVTGTLLWKMSQAHGTEDYPTIRRMIRIGVLAILVLLILIMPIVWVLRGTLIGGLHIPHQFADQAQWVLPAVVLLTVTIGINDIMGMAISGCQRSGTVTVIQACALVINYSCAIVLIRLDFGLPGLLIGMLSGALVASVMYFITASKLVGGISLLPTIPKREELTSMGKYAGLLMVGFSSAALRDQTDKLVLAGFASSTWVGYYGIAARLAFLVMEVARFFYSPLLTAAGSMHAAKNWAGVQRLYQNMMVLVGIAAGVVTVVVAGLHVRLMSMWVGYTNPNIATIALILLAGNASAVILTGPGTAICRAIGKVWVETAYVVVNLVGNLILTISLVLLMGAMGTVIASGSTWAVSAVVFTFILPKLVDLPKDATEKARWFMVAVIGCSGVVYYVAKLFPMPAGRLQGALYFFPMATIAALFYLGVITATGLVPRATVQKVSTRVLAMVRR